MEHRGHLLTMHQLFWQLWGEREKKNKSDEFFLFFEWLFPANNVSPLGHVSAECLLVPTQP